jgi:hypothetical protein
LQVGSLLCTLTAQARSAADVEALLRSGIRHSVAGPKLVTAALDRLRELHLSRRNRLQSAPSAALVAAFELAVTQGLVILPKASVEMMVALARASQQLGSWFREQRETFRRRRQAPSGPRA